MSTVVHWLRRNISRVMRHIRGLAPRGHLFVLNVDPPPHPTFDSDIVTDEWIIHKPGGRDDGTQAEDSLR